MIVTQAKKEHAAALAYLINLAGEGLPEFIWKGMATEGETPRDVGIRRAERKEGGFSHTKAKVICERETVAGMMIAYALDDPYELGNLEEYPEPVRPLIQLEARVPGSWYINALATQKKFRKRGVGTALLTSAEQDAISAGANKMSIIVSSENEPARSLYHKFGFKYHSELAVATFPGMIFGGRWQLLTKKLG